MNCKESTGKAGDLEFDPESERSSGEGNGCHPEFLPGEFHKTRAWRATVHGISKSWAQLVTSSYPFCVLIVMVVSA